MSDVPITGEFAWVRPEPEQGRHSLEGRPKRVCYRVALKHGLGLYQS